MRSGLTTLLLLIPILAVPMLAIFGIPNFAPAVASPLGDEAWREGPADRGGAAPTFGDAAGAQELVAQNGLDFSNNPRQSNLERNIPWPGRTRSEAAERTHPNPDASAGNFDGFDRTAAVIPPSAPPRRLPLGQEPGQPPAWPAAQDGAVQQIGYSVPEDFAGPPKYERPAQTDVEQVGFESSGRRGPRPPRVLPNATPALTWQDAVKRLDELEIDNFRLERGTDQNQFFFMCSYTPPENPQVSYRFEAEASEPLKAVEKVLAQVESRRLRPTETPSP